MRNQVPDYLPEDVWDDGKVILLTRKGYVKLCKLKGEWPLAAMLRYYDEHEMSLEQTKLNIQVERTHRERHGEEMGECGMRDRQE